MNIRSSLALFALLFLVIGVKSSQGSSIVEDVIVRESCLIKKVYIQNNEYVKRGQEILRWYKTESKFDSDEYSIYATKDGYVVNLNVKEGDEITNNSTLLQLSSTPLAQGPINDESMNIDQSTQENWRPLRPETEAPHVTEISLPPKRTADFSQRFVASVELPVMILQGLSIDRDTTFISASKPLEKPRSIFSEPALPSLADKKNAPPIFHSVSRPMKHFAGRLPQLTPKDFGLQIFDGTFYHQLFWLTFEAFLLFLTLALSDVKGWELVWASRGFLRRSVADLREAFLFTPPSRRVLKISPSGSRRWTS